MKGLLFALIFASSFHSFSQLFSQQIWLQTGAKINLNSKLSSSIDVTQRYGNSGLNTFFPQVSLRFKLTKWMRPSLDYRLIASQSLDGSYTQSHRLNGNLQLSHSVKRFSIGFRVRYQYSFIRLGSNYDAEFDQAWRFKPSIEYDIKNSAISPEVSAEFFYNPANAVNGKQFTRTRYYAGANMIIMKNHAIGLGMYLDQWLNDIPRLRCMYSISYSYSIPIRKKKETDSKNMRDL